MQEGWLEAPSGRTSRRYVVLCFPMSILLSPRCVAYKWYIYIYIPSLPPPPLSLFSSLWHLLLSIYKGTNVENGVKILKESGLPIIPAKDLDDAAKKAVEAAASAKKAKANWRAYVMSNEEISNRDRENKSERYIELMLQYVWCEFFFFFFFFFCLCPSALFSLLMKRLSLLYHNLFCCCSCLFAFEWSRFAKLKNLLDFLFHCFSFLMFSTPKSSDITFR